MKLIHFLLLSLLFSITTSCIETSISKGNYTESNENSSEAEKKSTIAGREKVLTKFSSRELANRELKLKEAEQAYSLNPGRETEIVWYGRRLAYLARYEESIAVFSDGLKKFPESYRLFRHRGHRYITIRRFDKAVEDLQKAAFFVREAPLIIEQDGIPNKLNKPLSNNKFNIWYHLGLAFYLKGNYDKAINSYKKCLEVSNNTDLQVATRYWLYLTYQKIGNMEAAAEAVQNIQPRMTLIENKSYHDLIMLFKGLVSPEILLMRNTSTSGDLDPTIGYGIANWMLSQGKIIDAQILMNRIVNTASWDSFGYIAAERDLANYAKSGNF